MNRVNRRSFLQYALSSSVGAALTSCSLNYITAPATSPAALAVEPIIDPKTLEKPNLTVGFVPVNDCAPFAVAYQKGLFRKYGLNVTLSREASWANSRDGVIFGRLDASPVVSGAVPMLESGLKGQDVPPYVLQ